MIRFETNKQTKKANINRCCFFGLDIPLAWPGVLHNKNSRASAKEEEKKRRRNANPRRPYFILRKRRTKMHKHKKQILVQRNAAASCSLYFMSFRSFGS